MKVIIAPDKFRGSLSSFVVCQAIEKGIKQADKAAVTFLFPMADGGDGFAKVMKHYLQTHTVNCVTVDPLGRKITGTFEWNAATRTAIIEMAVASGLELLSQAERNPLKTSTLGTGLIMKTAIDKGAKKIILGLGGSATNDAGIGILSAMGFQFRNQADKELYPSGGNLMAISRIVTPAPVPSVKLIIACDVQNVLYGPQGAAYVYAPQKGADGEMVKFLDEGLKHFAVVLKQYTGKDNSNVPGTGAAGGIAAGLMNFFDVEIKKGTDLIIEASDIKKKIAEAKLVITGEGKIDRQTLEGKVVREVALLAYRNKINVAAFCGILEADEELLNELHLDFANSLTDAFISKEQAMLNANELLTTKARQFFENYFAGK